MNMKKTLMAAAVALSLTAPAAFAAQNPNPPEQKRERKAAGFHGHHGFGKHMFGRAMAELNLTDQQKEFAKKLFAETRTQTQPLVQQMRENRKQLAEAIKANNASQIENLSQAQANLMRDVTAITSKAMASFYQQLTPEQRAKAEELRERVQNRMKERGQRWQQNR